MVVRALIRHLARYSSTSSCARRGSPASCSPASAPVRCWFVGGGRSTGLPAPVGARLAPGARRLMPTPTPHGCPCSRPRSRMAAAGGHGRRRRGAAVPRTAFERSSARGLVPAWSTCVATTTAGSSAHSSSGAVDRGAAGGRPVTADVLEFRRSRRRRPSSVVLVSCPSTDARPKFPIMSRPRRADSDMAVGRAAARAVRDRDDHLLRAGDERPEIRCAISVGPARTTTALSGRRQPDLDVELTVAASVRALVAGERCGHDQWRAGPPNVGSGSMPGPNPASPIAAIDVWPCIAGCATPRSTSPIVVAEERAAGEAAVRPGRSGAEAPRVARSDGVLPMKPPKPGSRVTGGPTVPSAPTPRCGCRQAHEHDAASRGEQRRQRARRADAHGRCRRAVGAVVTWPKSDTCRHRRAPQGRPRRRRLAARTACRLRRSGPGCRRR